jgi:DNA-binding transcriptional MocR family regulator
MSRTVELKRRLASSDGAPRYEQIAAAIEAAIDRGEFRAGERLPTVRALASQLDVSGASVAVAYNLLARRGRVHAQVGRGTFVSAPSAPNGVSLAPDPSAPRALPHRASESSRSLLMASWRRRALRFGDRLRALNPDALVCTTSWPDPALLPAEVLKRAFGQVMARLQPADLQYTGPEPHPELTRALLRHFERDGVPAGPDDLIIMSATKQLLTLALRVAPAQLESRELVVAVEEPGHYTMFDTIESLGHRLIGVDVDEEGAVPESLERALAQGANVVLLTPRAQNPTGASWTTERRAALADTIAEYPRALVIEDDHFAGISDGHPGSLLQDRRLEDRTIYARSFSKSMGPDLRTTLVAARPRLRAPLRDAKLVTDGWSPGIVQRAVAAALDDPELEVAFERARAAYAERREAATQAIGDRLPAARVAPAPDGVNIWIQLPAGYDVMDVMQNAAELGVLVSNGEAFYISPGHGGIRMSIGWLDREEARRAGELLAAAVLTVDDLPVSIVH